MWFLKRLVLVACLLAQLSPNLQAAGLSPFAIRDGEMVAFVGGTDVAAEQFAGHLETVLTISAGTNRVRFRNYGWEGDTIFEQPRDVGFPPLMERLRKEPPTKVFVQYGRAECLQGKHSRVEFRAVYEKLLETLNPLKAEVILVIPPPFEKGPELRPNLALRNMELSAYASVVRALAREKNLRLVDLFLEMGGIAPGEAITSDGLQISAKGYGRLSAAFLNGLGISKAMEAGCDDNGKFADLQLEKIRQVILQKNRLWFDYSRPQNWAFLGGDRVTQPSSRDHKDASVRWFPKEMEKFVPLIDGKEKEIFSILKESR